MSSTIAHLVLRLALVVSTLSAMAAGKERPVQAVLHFGMCDASAGCALGADLFAAGNDEDNTIRIYRANVDGPPIGSVNVTRFLELSRGSPEVDFEGAARIGNRIYWIGSHGRNARGEFAPNRQRLFAVEIQDRAGQPRLEPVGKPYTRLLADLAGHPALARFNLSRAASLAPKEDGALNIEGLCATKEGRLLIGFRNPIPEGRALVVPLLNPDALVMKGERAQLGDPLLLGLGGLGIRDLAEADGRHLIVGGHHDGGGNSRLFVWDGKSLQPEPIRKLSLKGLNPEGIITYPGKGIVEFQLLSDDGTRKIGGQDCKNIKDMTKKRFRSVWVNMTAAE